MVNRPRGTRDIIFPQTSVYQKVNSVCSEVLNSSNYCQIIFPTYEYEELFSNSLGESTDIVNKEMFTFSDRKGRKLVLRPEGTASVVRAVQQNKLIQSSTRPLKLYYWANMFRYERPQDGRYREFWQLGVELINAKGLYADCEILYTVFMIFQKLNIPGFWVSVNYLGSAKNRECYKLLLRNSIKDKVEKLCSKCKTRYDSNPLRIMDCEVCSSLEEVPDYSGSLTAEDESYFQMLSKQLSLLAVPYVVDRKLVRGLDYYTGLVFEVRVSSKKQSLAGGGRYDNLFSIAGKSSVPSIGFAIGVDRLVDFISSSHLQTFPLVRSIDVLFLPLCERAISLSFVSRRELIQSIHGKVVEVDFSGQNILRTFKQINYYNPKIVIFIGEKELEKAVFSIKNTISKEEFVVSNKEFVNTVKREINNF